MRINKSLTEWSELVQQIESGYEFGIADLENDLSSRKRLMDMDVLNSLSELERKKLEQLDNRFISLTRVRREPYFCDPLLDRIPLKLMGDLEEEVRDLGL